MGNHTCSGKKKRNVLREKSNKLWEKKGNNEVDDLYYWLNVEKNVKLYSKKNKPKDWL